MAAKSQGQLLAENAALRRELAETKKSAAKDTPVIIHRTEESGDISQPEPAEFDGGGELVKASPEQLDDPIKRAKLEDLAFMNDILTVHILTVADEDADPRFIVSVNGKDEVFVRGETKKCKRVFVEGLARAKQTKYGNEEYVRDDGTKDVRWPANRGVRFPFAVVEDPHPRGSEWLRHVLNQP